MARNTKEVFFMGKKKIVSMVLAALLAFGAMGAPIPAYAMTQENEVLATSTDGDEVAGVTDALDIDEIKSGAPATVNDVLVPTADNKKGIQGTEFMNSDIADSDPASLGVNHVLFNLELSKIISTDGQGVPYVYNGKTYYYNFDSSNFTHNYLNVFEWEVKNLKAQGKAITFVILMPWSDDPTLQNLIYPSARERGHYYYALNTEDANARETLDATFHFLAEVFGTSDTFVQNWIIGNEVNQPHQYNYTGTMNKRENVDICVKSYDLLYNALKDNNPNAKSYISLTNSWNNTDEGRGITTRYFLDEFAKRENGKDWNIAFHAYPPVMSEYVWSKNSARFLRHDVGSMFVCGANLEVLTDYVKNNYGSKHRIILSEQSYDSTYGEDAQAAMIAYTYYAGARNDMVDAVIFTSWADSNNAVYDGYKLGIVDINGRKKEAYNVFKYMNTSQKATYTNKYLNYLHINNWSDNILYQSPATDAVLTGSSLYLAEHTKDKVMIGLTTSTSKQTDLEYKWTIFNENTGDTYVISDWTTNFEWLVWKPEMGAEFQITGEVRVAGNPSSYAKHTTKLSHHPYIKGKCQMPYEGKGGGYLIGFESFSNPNQEYTYEMLILDCTLLAEGKDAWVYTTTPCHVPETSLWTIWQPQYGYYWTLFRLYDKYGDMIDQECYGFVNAY